MHCLFSDIGDPAVVQTRICRVLEGLYVNRFFFKFPKVLVDPETGEAFNAVEFGGEELMVLLSDELLVDPLKNF